MKRRSQKHGTAGQHSCVEKMAVAAGSLVGLGLLPGAAEATPITIAGSPVTLSLSAPHLTEVTWDVDGVNGAEFTLWKSNSYSVETIFLASRNNASVTLNGNGLVAPYFTDNVLALHQSAQVGPTLASGVWGSASGYRYRNAMERYGTGPITIGYDFNFGFAPGDNFIGFRFFDSLAQNHYGFARINFDTVNGSVSLLDWVYESEADTAVHVDTIQTVPEPASLTLLALGAAGLVALRRRKKSAAEDQTNA